MYYIIDKYIFIKLNKASLKYIFIKGGDFIEGNIGTLDNCSNGLLSA